MGRLLDIARAHRRPPETTQAAPGGAARERLSDFATAGRAIRLWSDVLGEEVVFAGDGADVSGLPPGTVVYRARELEAVLGVSPGHLRSIHAAKKEFGGEVSA